jgi:hypothetical protein
MYKPDQVMFAWTGDSEGHARAGRIGGKRQGWKTNKGNFRNNREKARRAGAIGGKAKKKRSNDDEDETAD